MSEKRRESVMSYVLAIDGGGTKTTGVLADETGEIIAQATVGASNPNIVKPSDLLKTFSELKDKLKQENEEAFKRTDRLFAGISGTGHPSAKQTVYEVIEDVMPSTVSITIDNDAIIALYSGTLGKPGIVQISGTGSITYGVNGEGKRDRVGGWGHFVGEKGSGYGLGSDALQAAFSAHDKIGPGTILEDVLQDFFKKSSLPDIIPLIYQAENPKETIASLGRLVMEAADQGDAVARDIIHQNGLYIGQCVSALINKIFSDVKENDEAIPVVLAGGLFNRVDLFQDVIEEELKKQLKPARIVIPDRSPVGGAVIAALMMDR